MTTYDRLAELTADELRLVREGDVAQLPALQAERARLMTELSNEFGPDTAGRRSALERVALLQAEIVAALQGARDATARELAHLRRGRGAVRAYGHVAATSSNANRLA
jgi:Flagellar protein FliT